MKLNAKDMLKKAGIRQADIARALGVTRQCVNAALNGECVTRVHEHVAGLLGRPVAELFAAKQRPGRPARGGRRRCGELARTNTDSHGPARTDTKPVCVR